MTKLIGIPGWNVGETTFGVSHSYLQFICKFGKPVIILPQDEISPPEVDMILCPGGADILPTSYGAVPNFKTNKPNTMLEHFDGKILPQYIENGTPVFAICRGMQSLWARYGGQIEQDNGWHEQSSKFPQEQVHELCFTDAFKEFNKLIDKVTSRHHQCADASVFIPDELEVIAYASAGKSQFWRQVVEIFRHKTLPITGVQFHPEDHDNSDQLSSTIIKGYLHI